MGQIKAIYQGNTFRLQQALNLRDKEYLTLEEMSAVIEGGKLCTDRGVKLLAAPVDYPEKARLVQALALTGNSLAARAISQLESESSRLWPMDKSSALKSSIDEVLNDSRYLALWAEKLSDDSGAMRFDA